MPALRFPLSAALALLVAACAGSPEDGKPTPETAAPAMVPVPAPLPAPNATWVITDLYDPGQLDYGVIGQTVQLTDKQAGDVLGRTCLNPSYMPVQTDSADALGRSLDVVWNHPVKGFEVWCGAIPFGLYIQARDGSYLSRQADGVMRFALSTGEAPPPAPNYTMAPIFAAMDRPQTAAEAGTSTMPPPPAKPDKGSHAGTSASGGRAVYLASYPSRAQAEQDWKRLHKAHPHLSQAQPDYRAVDLGKKGKFVRLFAVGKGDAASLCKPLKRRFADCGADWATRPQRP